MSQPGDMAWFWLCFWLPLCCNRRALTSPPLQSTGAGEPICSLGFLGFLGSLRTQDFLCAEEQQLLLFSSFPLDGALEEPSQNLPAHLLLFWWPSGHLPSCLLGEPKVLWATFGCRGVPVTLLLSCLLCAMCCSSCVPSGRQASPVLGNREHFQPTSL